MSELSSKELSEEALREILTRGELELEGRFVDSSNATCLVRCELDAVSVQAVYKPERGERPLWDFPQGLWKREIAAYELASSMGSRLIPITLRRETGPAGLGSLQLYREPDEGGDHYFSLRDDERYQEDFRFLATFDVLANNSDRKSGHVFVSRETIVAIDHGLCFHEEDKLRTVIWEFANEEISEQAREGLERISSGVFPALLPDLLSPGELAMLRHRAKLLLDEGLLPNPDEDQGWPPYPWPLI
ncbi:MAG: SCO1664 family protein [Actinomycetota bacterium]